MAQIVALTRRQTREPVVPYDETLPVRFVKYEAQSRFRAYGVPPGRPVVTSFAPDPETMSKLGVYREYLSIMKKCGLRNPDVLTNKTYPPLVKEFHSSFHVYKDKKGEFSEWKFRLQNRNFDLSKRDVCRLLGFPFRGNKACYSYAEKWDFWKRISGEDDMFDDDVPVIRIKDGIWRYMNCLVATCFVSSTDEGAYVTEANLELLLAFSAGIPIDFFHVLTKILLKLSDPIKQVPPTLGCSTFITQLAASCGITFDHPIMNQKSGVIDVQLLSNLRVIHRGQDDRLQWLTKAEYQEIRRLELLCDDEDAHSTGTPNTPETD